MVQESLFSTGEGLRFKMDGWMSEAPTVVCLMPVSYDDDDDDDDGASHRRVKQPEPADHRTAPFTG